MNKLIFISGMLFLNGCVSDPIVEIIHKPLVIPSQCNFEKFTEKEKETITNDVGSKIYSNQQLCRLRQIRIIEIISAHNKAHN